MKTTTKLMSALALAFLFGPKLSAQEALQAGNEPPQPQSTYQLADEVRNSMTLEGKEFDKVYSAYEKYNKSVFGDTSGSSGSSGRPQGRPGGMGGPGGGMGGPGGGMGPGGAPPSGGGFGGPGSGSGSRDFEKGTQPKQKSVDMEKFEKKRAKAEEKLRKKIQKIFKKHPEKYDQWLSIREAQLKRATPPQRPDDGNRPDGDKPHE